MGQKWNLGHYQFPARRRRGNLGIIPKATTGATGKDSEYANRRRPVLDAGLLWGAYHWGTNADVSAQVDNFLSVADPTRRRSSRSITKRPKAIR
jgi:GH25 family lysozyme M1 (1,4-beta-N-acetylmuramidase)